MNFPDLSFLYLASDALVETFILVMDLEIVLSLLVTGLWPRKSDISSRTKKVVEVSTQTLSVSGSTGSSRYGRRI